MHFMNINDTILLKHQRVRKLYTSSFLIHYILMKNCFYYKLIFLENIILLINYLYIYFSKRFHCISSIFSKQMLLVRHSSRQNYHIIVPGKKITRRVYI